MLSPSADKGPGVRQVINSFITHTTKSPDAQPDPAAGHSKCINFVLHAVGHNPGSTPIEQHRHTGGAEKLHPGRD